MMTPIVGHREIKAFAEERVNLPAATALKHRAQVKALRERLQEEIDDHPDYGLVKMLHAGSVAKGTALQNVNDLDAAVYVKKSAAPSNSDAALVTWLADRLFEANKALGMKREQFVENPHCVTVNFKRSGLNVDVVPVLYEGGADDRGYLVRKHTGDRVLTSITLHLRFIRDRKMKYGVNFAELIRLTKWWAHLADDGLTLDDYTTALERFFVYVVKTGLELQVSFTDFFNVSEIPTRSKAAIEVLDPVNLENNVAVHYGVGDRTRIVAAAQAALDAISEARFAPTKSRSVECWQTVLGPTFKG